MVFRKTISCNNVVSKVISLAFAVNIYSQMHKQSIFIKGTFKHPSIYINDVLIAMCMLYSY